MTLKEFYKLARRVKWTVTKGGAVRTKNRVRSLGSRPDFLTGLPKRLSPGRLCPLAYVLGSWGGCDTPIGDAAARQIAARADGDAGWRGRYRLKRALGLAK